MAETKRYGLGNLLDIEQILLEAQHRWLRPAEICEILQNYEKFSIAPEPANMPPSGSLFLFDRKVLRYFRKDGHNWRKKKDGKTIKEAHERLKAGSVDVLHCYYAHGEENENFQRRSYWMLEEELSHIVLVHYREVKGNRMQFNRLKENQEAVPYSQEAEELISNEVDSSRSSSFRQNDYQMRSLTMDTTSASGAQTSEYEDAESVYNPQASSRFHPFLELQQPAIEKIDAGFSNPCYPAPFSNDYQGKLSTIPGIDFSLNQADKVKDSNDAGLTYESRKHLDFQSWEDVLGNCTSGVESDPLQPSFISTKPDTIGHIPKQEHERLGQLFTDSPGERQNFGSQPHVSQKSEAFKYDSSHLSKQPTDQQLPSNFPYDLTSRFNEPYSSFPEKPNNVSGLNDLLMPHLNTELKPDSERNLTLDGKAIYSSAIKQHLLDGSPSEEGLRKLDSFNRWMSKELGDVNDLEHANESHMQSSSGAYWETVASENGVSDASHPSQGQLNTYMMSPSLSQDQLFSIIDFSPSWTYVGSEVKVLIMGRFLKSQQEAENCKWSCMFGEVEVFAEIIANGVLSCHAPLHEAGRVPFYVTCSNRLACSEVREFEYKVSHIRDLDKADNDGGNAIENLHVRFGKLLCSSAVFQKSDTQNVHDVSQISSKITPLLKESIDEWDQMLKVTSAQEFSPEKVKDQLLEKLLKEKLHSWLLQKVAEGGKGPNVLDEGGQGVVHLAAALGYDWALEPTILAGVNVNFRDANGWTALHWAAFCGREHTVGSLVALGAAPGALTDPTPKYPSGSTPADLASANGHKGIAGYLAESDLSAHLSYLSLDKQGGDAAEISGTKAVQTAPERNAVPVSYEDLQQGSSLKNSLAAVCNATQAAARIHQVFRVQSFQKKQLKELGDDKFGMSDERALSLIALKTNKLAQHDEPVHAAAIRIQNKFRSWKGRKDYLIIRQRIVKIQAQWRGHQVRKNYKKIVWSVGILEKVILRWRRKGSGLRGFKSEALNDDMQDTSLREDDDDFFKEGRKQTEERLQKALARVKSMVQYPEARDQYHRLLNVVTEIQETKADKVLNSSEETIYLEDDLVDIEALLDDDTLMPTAS